MISYTVRVRNGISFADPGELVSKKLVASTKYFNDCYQQAISLKQGVFTVEKVYQGCRSFASRTNDTGTSIAQRIDYPFGTNLYEFANVVYMLAYNTRYTHSQDLAEFKQSADIDRTLSVGFVRAPLSWTRALAVRMFQTHPYQFIASASAFGVLGFTSCAVFVSDSI